MPDDARVINGRLYTLRRAYDPWGGKPQFPWVGYCDGDRIGFYRLKCDFWSAAAAIERGRDPACDHARKVEAEYAVMGGRLLDRLHLFHGKHMHKTASE